MFSPYLKPMVCVGGPCHGEFVDGERGHFDCHLNTTYKKLYLKENIQPPTQSYLRLNYKRQHVCADLGNLRIEGWAYVWCELHGEQQMMEMIWAMLIASNLKTSTPTEGIY